MSKVILNRVKAGDLELKEKVVAINRVVKTTKGGRAFSFSALVVVGNESGVVGHGLGKAKEVQEAITKGIEDAKKNLIKVPVMHGTIPHDQLAKEGAAKVLIKPAAHGTGVIAGGSMRAVLESAGITDVLAKSLGSANPHNVVKATFRALAMLREPIQVSRTRQISLKKVFNGKTPVCRRVVRPAGGNGSNNQAMAKIKITQVKSGIDRPERQKLTLK